MPLERCISHDKVMKFLSLQHIAAVKVLRSSHTYWQLCVAWGHIPIMHCVKSGLSSFVESSIRIHAICICKYALLCNRSSCPPLEFPKLNKPSAGLSQLSWQIRGVKQIKHLGSAYRKQFFKVFTILRLRNCNIVCFISFQLLDS